MATHVSNIIWLMIMILSMAYYWIGFACDRVVAGETVIWVQEEALLNLLI